jgi:hypothetical protein
VHAAQFQAAPYANKCEACHTVNDFQATTFTLTRHRESKFVLSGAHGAVACVDCHKPQPVIGSAVRYRFADTSCTACHRDPHDISRLPNSADNCESCHTVRTWTTILSFDHSKTRFALDGVHRSVTCLGCHKPANSADNLKRISFKDKQGTCAGCHEDVHGAQFAAKAADCVACHVTARWRPSLFDHEKTRFSLLGAHQSVRCEACHENRRNIGQRLVLVYAGTPKECASCH